MFIAFLFVDDELWLLYFYSTCDVWAATTFLSKLASDALHLSAVATVYLVLILVFPNETDIKNIGSGSGAFWPTYFSSIWFIMTLFKHLRHLHWWWTTSLLWDTDLVHWLRLLQFFSNSQSIFRSSTLSITTFPTTLNNRFLARCWASLYQAGCASITVSFIWSLKNRFPELLTFFSICNNSMHFLVCDKLSSWTLCRMGRALLEFKIFILSSSFLVTKAVCIVAVAAFQKLCSCSPCVGLSLDRLH